MREEVSRGGARARRVDASRETGSRRSLGDVRDDGEENVVDVVSKRVARNLFPHAFAFTLDDDASGCERIATRLNARFTSSTLGRERAGKPNVSRWAPMSSSRSSSFIFRSSPRRACSGLDDENARAGENRRSTLDGRRSTLDGRRSMTEDERSRAENTRTHTHTRGAPTHPAQCRDESRAMPWTHPIHLGCIACTHVVFNI